MTRAIKFLVCSLFVATSLVCYSIVFLPGLRSASSQVPVWRNRWEKGSGWGWIWGGGDEVGALNAMNPQTVVKAFKLVKKGTIYDLGLTYDRASYKAAVHSPGEIISFRTPEGVKRQKDLPFYRGKDALTSAWHSCALFINDNVATQIDGLGHITTGDDNHWYNGYKEADWSGNFGIRKAGAETIPPIVNRGVLIDVAGYKKVATLPPHYAITPQDLQETLKWQGVELEPGDVVLVRTGTASLWGETGSDHQKIAGPDKAGINLAAARWLVEEKGAIMIGGDTSGLEWVPKDSGIALAVHIYLLIEQGVHVGEFHNLEEVSRKKVYQFAYVALTNKIKGTVAGFAMRPVAIE